MSTNTEKGLRGQPRHRQSHTTLTFPCRRRKSQDLSRHVYHAQSRGQECQTGVSPGSTFSDTLASEKSPRGRHLTAAFHNLLALHSTQTPTKGGESHTVLRGPAGRPFCRAQKHKAWCGCCGEGVRGLCPCKVCPAAGPAPQLSLH